jgi:hypothetical protein
MVVVRSGPPERQLQHVCSLEKVCMFICTIRYKEDNWGVTTKQIVGYLR